MSSQSNSPEPQDAVALEIPPEHVISPALRRRLQQCFDHGQKLIGQEKRDHDYINTMFSECVAKDPSNLVYVEAFLGNLQHKYNNNKRGARFMLGGGNRGEFKKALTKKNWIEVLQLGPELLKSNPWDVATLRGMAQACEAYRYNEVELRYLKNALDANPKDIDVNRHCALSLARMGQFDQAIACWHRIEELKPHNAEASKMIADLSIERTRAQAGYGPPLTNARRGPVAAGKPAASGEKTPAATPSTPATAAPADAPAPAAPPPKREIQLTPVQQLERAIADDPTIVENYLELVDLYLQDRRFAEAERVVQRAQSASPGNSDVRAKAEEFVLRKAGYQVEVAEKQAEQEKTPQARELVEQLRTNLARLELEVFDARSQRFPEDLELKHRVGQCQKRMGNYREAALRFQESRADERWYVEATLELGECLQHMKQYVKALHCYQRAAEKAPTQDPTRKLALYRAGVLAAGLKEWATAEAHFRQITALDPSYKDVQARLDKMQAIDDKG